MKKNGATVEPKGRAVQRENSFTLQNPQSIKDALTKFFNIHDGKLTNISAKERSKLADNICFVATGIIFLQIFRPVVMKM